MRFFCPLTTALCKNGICVLLVSLGSELGGSVRCSIGAAPFFEALYCLDPPRPPCTFHPLFFLPNGEQWPSRASTQPVRVCLAPLRSHVACPAVRFAVSTRACPVRHPTCRLHGSVWPTVAVDRTWRPLPENDISLALSPFSSRALISSTALGIVSHRTDLQATPPCP